VLDHREVGRPTSEATGPQPSWSRSTWTALADQMLKAVRPYAPPGRSTLPAVRVDDDGGGQVGVASESPWPASEDAVAGIRG
jgi:hypothetical protein